MTIGEALKAERKKEIGIKPVSNDRKFNNEITLFKN